MPNEAHYRIVDFLFRETGQYLAENRRWRVDSTLRPILVRHGMASLKELAHALHEPERHRLRHEVIGRLANNETCFFRDPRVFDMLDREVLTQLHNRKADTKQLRIWFAGCSTGQEPYSVAMLLAEQRQRWQDWTIELIASDISSLAIEQASRGIYSQFEIQRGLSVRRIIRWFDQHEQQWQVLPDLRDRISFHVADLRAGPPVPGPYDLILCRNVLLYFDTGIRADFLHMLADNLSPSGFLMLGAGETVVGQSGRFRCCLDLPCFHVPDARSGDRAMGDARRCHELGLH